MEKCPPRGVASAVDMSLDAIVCSDEKDRIILWNPAAGRMFGYAREEALGMKTTDLMPEEYREAHRRGMERFVETGRTSYTGKTVEVEALRRDGSVFPIELSLAAERDDGGWIFTSVIRDITGRKAEERRASDRATLLKELNDHLSVLLKMSSTVNRNLDLNTLLKEALLTITSIDILNVEKRGGIFLVESNTMKLAAHLGHSSDFLKKHEGMRVGDCLCGIAAESGEVLVSTDSHYDPRHTIRYEEMAPHGHVIVPLKARERVVGVMYLYLPPLTVVREAHIRVLDAVGDQLGIAISNAKLFEETRELSLKDPLTGLANRRLMYEALARDAARAEREGSPLSALMLDLDRFKDFNDAEGHVAGDELLTKVGRMVKETVRESDLVARYGGEEFFVLLPGIDAAAAREAAERIRRAVEEATPVTVSLGVAEWRKGVTVDSFIKAADDALYLAKERGRNRVEEAD